MLLDYVTNASIKIIVTLVIWQLKALKEMLIGYMTDEDIEINATWLYDRWTP
jgi:hypothetical protein